MARAEQTAVGDMLKLGELCDDCTFRDAGAFQPEYLVRSGSKIDAELGINAMIDIISLDGEAATYLVAGIPSNRDLSESFKICEGSEIYDNKIVCGAIARLNRRNRNGREKI